MNNSAFLDSEIWSVNIVQQPYIDHNFYLVTNVYYYNSLKSGIVNFDLECIQIPLFEIHNIHLLDKLDYNLINKNSIPILYRYKDDWKIDLRIYEDFKLQSPDIPSV
jgi:hypothetical protein